MENSTTLFDIIGPIIVGPSSSHTAGAVRIGLMSRNIYGKFFNKVKFVLYNSFAKTGKGHGTDKALLAGVLGFEVNDERIKNSFMIAKQENIDLIFENKEDFNRHPNSVDIIFGDKSEMKISANSVGAGEIEIIKINNYNFKLKGDYPTLLLTYQDKPGMVSKVTKLIQDENINIAYMNCYRSSKGEEASMCICLDSKLPNIVVEKIKKMIKIYFITNIEALKR